jgi:hypothetical protein
LFFSFRDGWAPEDYKKRVEQRVYTHGRTLGSEVSHETAAESNFQLPRIKTTRCPHQETGNRLWPKIASESTPKFQMEVITRNKDEWGYIAEREHLDGAFAGEGEEEGENKRDEDGVVMNTEKE